MSPAAVEARHSLVAEHKCCRTERGMPEAEPLELRAEKKAVAVVPEAAEAQQRRAEVAGQAVRQVAVLRPRVVAVVGRPAMQQAGCSAQEHWWQLTVTPLSGNIADSHRTQVVLRLHISGKSR